VNARAERAAVAAFAVAIAGGIIAAIGYATEHTHRVLGLGLAAALFGIGFGLVAWAKSLGIDEHVAEAREVPDDRPDELRNLRDEVAESSAPLGRRRALQALFAGSLGALVIGFVGPLGSLGPRPRGERRRTSWERGRRLVTSDGQPIDALTERLDQLLTVFPEGAVGRDDSQAVLLRVRPDLLTARTVDGGAVDGWVAYSKICTHAGCSVGLFGVDSRAPIEVRELVCPCHQSVFDPLDAARPVGGPAPRSLPQLPLAVDEQGFLVATADFDRVVGPITWSEG
jgi:ubiquinol-cytochrome c reductase iron-sulfur subunit